MGRRQEALETLNTLAEKRRLGIIKYVSGWHEALIYAGVGEVDNALLALERAYDEPCDWLVHLAIEPRWKNLREEHRFQELVRRVGIRVANPR
jgi:hypothetical protein